MPGPYREVQDLYFHAGQDFVLNTRDVIGVFDLDTAGASRRTEEIAAGKSRPADLSFEFVAVTRA